MGSRTKYKTKSFVVTPPERWIASKDVMPVVSHLARGKLSISHVLGVERVGNVLV